MGKWRQRVVEHRLAGLYDELRSGRPRSIDDEQIAVLLKRTLSRKPVDSTHGSIRHPQDHPLVCFEPSSSGYYHHYIRRDDYCWITSDHC